MSNYNGDQTILEFRGHTKHFFSDKRYYIRLTRESLIISQYQSFANPKYTLRVIIGTQITWILSVKQHDINLQAFEFPYKDKKKVMYANEKDLRELKAQLSGRIFFGSISSFYTPLDLLGSGSFASVVVCKDIITNLKYAVKGIKKADDDQGKGSVSFEMLKNEIHVLRLLTDAQGDQDLPVVKVKEVFDGGSDYYIVMDHYEGSSLQNEIDRLQKQKRLFKPQTIQQIMKQLLQGIDFIHRNGIMHRDLKPDNIMFRRKYDYSTLKIIDFGLSTKIEMEKFFFHKCGTPGYVAPEILNSRDKYTEKVDLFSSGCIFFLLLTGRNLFQAGSQKKLLSQNKRCHIDFDEQLANLIGPNEYKLLIGLLNLNPIKRFSASEALKSPYFTQNYSDTHDLQSDSIVLMANGSGTDKFGQLDWIESEILDETHGQTIQVAQFFPFKKPLASNSKGLIDLLNYDINDLMERSCLYVESFYVKNRFSNYRKLTVNQSNLDGIESDDQSSAPRKLSNLKESGSRPSNHVRNNNHSPLLLKTLSPNRYSQQSDQVITKTEVLSPFQLSIQVLNRRPKQLTISKFVQKKFSYSDQAQQNQIETKG